MNQKNMATDQKVSGLNPDEVTVENQRVTLICNPFVFYHSVTKPIGGFDKLNHRHYALTGKSILRGA